jgi:hypothetical protein
MPEHENTDAAATPPVPPPPLPGEPASTRGSCGNCGTPLLGEYCYACGQPVRGLVRHFGSIMGDFADTVLNWDSRLPRTLWPLLVRPGFLTGEYFAGRRVRYVSPVRLFVTLAIVTFFFAQLMLSFGDNVINFDTRDKANFADANTVEEVVKQRDAALAGLEQARKENEDGVPGVSGGLGIAEKAIRDSAQARIAALEKRKAEGKPPPEQHEGEMMFNGRPWDAKTNPLTVSWWPDFANRWLNAQVGRAQINIKRMQQDQDLAKDAFLSAVPSTLFALLPVFALMLLVLYVFKRRLYMEHLLVALHSHAFLCLALLLLLVTMALQDWLAPGAGALHSLFTAIEVVLWIWMPLYLLLMQKRVYGQGWTMTLLKYSVLGLCYVFLLSFGAVFTVLFALVYG